MYELKYNAYSLMNTALTLWNLHTIKPLDLACVCYWYDFSAVTGIEIVSRANNYYYGTDSSSQRMG